MCKYLSLSIDLLHWYNFILLSLNKTLKLFVAGYDGVVCVYEVNTIDGGECKQIGQYLLFSMSPNQQTKTTNEARNSIGKSESCFFCSMK
jgi:hypothetical protein